MATDSYHHGALHAALIKAALREARRGGPQAVQVRSLAKDVGVSPSAVYRHFPSIDALLAEVGQAAREEMGKRLIRQRDKAPHARTRAARADARFRAMGRAYVQFAVDEPHLFDTAFSPNPAEPARPDDPSPWQLLTEGVAELVEAGVIPPADADRAALIAWANVQGIAWILVRQARVMPVDRNATIDTVIDATMRSLATL